MCNWQRTSLATFSGNYCLYPLLVLLILFQMSCGRREVKPLSQEAEIAKEAFRVSDILRNAYIQGDHLTLKENSTEDYYRELIRTINGFDSIELIFTPTWVEIEGSVVHLTVSWKGRWILKGKSTEDRGVAIFVFKGNPLKLERILRETPFRKSGGRIYSTPCSLPCNMETARGNL